MRRERTKVTSAAIPTAVNLSLASMFLALNAVQFLALPAVLLPVDPLWGLCLVPIAFATPSFWSVIHEAFHGVLHPDQRVNNAVGRVLCVAFGSPFRLLRFGHLMHHKLSRTAFDSAEVYDPNRTSWLRAASAYYPRLLFGLYVAELLSSVALLLPKRVPEAIAMRAFAGDPAQGVDTVAAARKALFAGDRFRELRLDGLAVTLLFGASFWLYGEYWPMLLAALLARGLLISILDNAPHYGTPLGDNTFSYNLRLPSSLSRLFLNFNLHRTHHGHPNLPWIALPDLFSRKDGRVDGSFARIVLRQLRGPISLSSLPRWQTEMALRH